MLESSLLLSEVVTVFALLGASTLVYGLCKRAQIPFAVGLLLTGLLLSFAGAQWGFDIEQYIRFSPDIVFYVFLPSLIFEAAYHMDFRNLKGVMAEVVVLATFGLFCSIALIGFLLYGAGFWFDSFLSLPLGVTFLFGALISATDPVAILAIFKEVKVPRRLSTILDGESLLNDATALMIFQLLLGTLGVGAISSAFLGEEWWLEQIFSLFGIIFLSLFIGALLGFVFSYVIAHSRSRKIQITLSLLLAHSTFILAENYVPLWTSHQWHASGILATTVAGLFVGNFGKLKLNAQTKRSLSEIWDFLGFLANALIFLLLGTKLGGIHLASYWPMILISAVVTIFIARPLAVWLSIGVTNLFRSHRITFKEQGVVVWGGLRGALAAAAVLLIPESWPVAEPLQAMTAGVILMTFVCNALSMRPLLRYFRFGEYTMGERIQHLEAQMLVDEKIVQYLNKILDLRYVTPQIHEELVQQYQTKAKDMASQIKALKKECTDHGRETEKILSHFALGIELRTYQKLFEYHEISEERYRTLRSSVHRQIDRLEQDMLPEETKKTSKIAPQIPTDKVYFASIKWVRRLCWKWFVGYRRYKILSRWQHYRARRIASWKVIRDFTVLHKEHADFKQSKVLDRIIKRYKEWHHNSQQKIAQLEKEFPDLIHQTQRQFVQHMCLKREEVIEREFLDKGFINLKVFEDLEKDIGERIKETKTAQ